MHFFFLELRPHEMRFFFVPSQLEPKPLLDDRSDKVAIVAFPYVYLEGLFVSLDIEWAINAVCEVDHKEEFSVLVDLVVDTVIAHVLQ